jgi:CheY-like chemotaxis protein
MTARRVLLVEDAAEVALLAEVLLSTLDDVEVTTAVDGLSGVAQARALVPHLVLLDLTLPGLSGRQVLELLRADPRTAATKVALFTGSAGESHDELLALGADAVLRKPFDPDSLLGSVTALLGEQEVA